MFLPHRSLTVLGVGMVLLLLDAVEEPPDGGVVALHEGMDYERSSFRTFSPLTQ